MAAWIDLNAGRLANPKRTALMSPKLMPAWLRLLAASACGQTAGGVLIGSDVVVTLPPIAAQDDARRTLLGLMDAWAEQDEAPAPLPTALRTALAWLQGGELFKAAQAYEGAQGRFGEREEACLRRLFPDFEALVAGRGFEPASRRLYEAFAEWVGALPFETLPDAAPDDEGDDG